MGAGAFIGAKTAREIPMTMMPELVAAFHSLVGLAAVFVAAGALYAPDAFGILADPANPSAGIKGASLFEMALGVAIGAITFTGSVIAFAKLSGRMSGKPIMLPMRHLINASLGIFIILLIFSAFAVPQAYQHRVLFWGIVGALVMRAALIAVAGVLLSTLHFVIYIFGAFLIFTGIKFLREQDHQPDLERHPVVRFANRIFRTSHEYDGQKFFTRKNGLLYATPLFVTLLLIEATDLVFAVDSIPAIYAITDDPFIVFTSNIFAILGLRSLYFLSLIHI